MKVIFDEKSITDKVLIEHLSTVELNRKNDDKTIVIDFERSSFIKGSAVAKLCCFSEKCKEYGMSIFLIPSYQIAYYLGDLGFWELADDYNLFTFDSKYLDYKSNNNYYSTKALFRLSKSELDNKYQNEYEFASWVSEKKKFEIYVTAELLGVGNSIERSIHLKKNISERSRAVLSTVSNFTYYSENVEQDTITRPIIQLVHNAVWHSRGNCYFFVQTSRYKNSFEQRMWVGVDISIADSGCGLYSSLISKASDGNNDYKKSSYKFYGREGLKSINEKYEQGQAAILEALFFRKDDGERGLFHILNDLVHENEIDYRKISISTNNTILSLGEGEYMSNGNKIDKRDISELLRQQESKIDILEYLRNMTRKINYIGVGSCFDISLVKNISERG